MSRPAPILEAAGVEKWRGGSLILTGINAEVRAGEVLAIIGPNGSGKTTLIETFEGLQRPDGGWVRVFGEDPVRLTRRSRSRMGVFLQATGVPGFLTVREVTKLFAVCFGAKGPVDDLLRRVGLLDRASRDTRKLSEGEYRRMSLALAFIKPFDLLLLDEPTAGIDPDGRREVWDLIVEARQRGTSVVFTTHHMDEAQTLSDRVLVMRAGHMVLCDTPAALLDRCPAPEKVDLVYAPGESSRRLEALPGVARMIRNGSNVTLYCRSATDVMRTLLADRDVARMAGGAISMEDAYRLLSDEAPVSDEVPA